MLKNYEDALNWLYNQPTGKNKSDLADLTAVLQKLNNPHLKIPIIHVTGTNGKGSTVAFLRNILQAHDLNVMTFTSPHLLKFNERIQLNGQSISDDKVVEYVNQLKNFSLVQFEYFFCLFCLYMAEMNPDVAIVEVGVGGLLDSTNVVQPNISLITNVGVDHTGLLGNTKTEIAYQKAGIIKLNTPVVIGQMDAITEKIFHQVAKEKQAPMSVYGKDFEGSNHHIKKNKQQSFYWNNCCFETNMIGRHQSHNAVLALQSAKLYLGNAFDNIKAQQGVYQTAWAGRMEKVNDMPLIFVDGAHNEHGIKALTQTIRDYFPMQQVSILFGSLERKEYTSMLKTLIQYHDVYVTTFDYYQSASVETLLSASHYKATPVSNWKQMLHEWIAQNKECILIITGSLYFISEVKHYFLNDVTNKH